MTFYPPKRRFSQARPPAALTLPPEIYPSFIYTPLSFARGLRQSHPPPALDSLSNASGGQNQGREGRGVGSNRARRGGEWGSNRRARGSNRRARREAGTPAAAGVLLQSGSFKGTRCPPHATKRVH